MRKLEKVGEFCTCHMATFLIRLGVAFILWSLIRIETPWFTIGLPVATPEDALSHMLCCCGGCLFVALVVYIADEEAPFDLLESAPPIKT